MPDHATGAVGAESGFAGSIGRTVAESTPKWPEHASESVDRPNVVIIVLDDVGFGQLGCYGSSIQTPHIDALAAGGLRYRDFHVTAMCSPTRSSLLTGRNHHTVGMGYLADFDSGFPSYRGAITSHAATLAEMLGAEGYGTYAAGKWHVAPPKQLSPAGPFDQWPTGRGFDRFYGFLGGEDDQWAPELWEDQHHVAPAAESGTYHFSEALAERSCRFLADHLTAAPDRPFFLYLSFGACHAPHQVPFGYADAYRGTFDDGWDSERSRQLERQISDGIVPAGTTLPPSNPDVPAWHALTENERRVCARMQEVFAGFLTHTDEQIGRVVEFLRAQNQLDNTLIIVLSDNGASAEGGTLGSVNEYRYFLGLPDDASESTASIDQIGGPLTHNHYPSGWAQAGNTPLRYYKKHNFGGGIRVPLIVHWSGHIPDPGAVREQFHHVVDIAPTILELTATVPQESYAGVTQMPLHGISMGYTLGSAMAPSRRETQYFEMGGHRGIWHQGWKAVTYHEPGETFDNDRWHLFHLPTDYSESIDHAEAEPERLHYMTQLWWQEAERYCVFPLDDRAQERAYAGNPLAQERSHFVLLPSTRLLTSAVGPNFARRPFRLSAEVDQVGGNTEGVLVAHGRRAAGFSLFVHDSALHFDYNLAGRHTHVSSPHGLLAGSRQLAAELSTSDSVTTLDLLIDGHVVAKTQLPQSFPAGFGCLTTQCGMNSPSPISPLYTAPFVFTASLRRVVIELDAQTTDDPQARLSAALRRQ